MGGLACAPLDETDGSIEALIVLADKRLYSAKHAGRNRVFAAQTKAACRDEALAR
jgi:PleD family two-component response regulator